MPLSSHRAGTGGGGALWKSQPGGGKGIRTRADRHPGRYGCRPRVWARFNKSGAQDQRCHDVVVHGEHERVSVVRIHLHERAITVWRQDLVGRHRLQGLLGVEDPMAVQVRAAARAGRALLSGCGPAFRAGTGEGGLPDGGATAFVMPLSVAGSLRCAADIPAQPPSWAVLFRRWCRCSLHDRAAARTSHVATRGLTLPCLGPMAWEIAPVPWLCT